MPKFSIIIPVYNTSDYLEMCLESLQNQTYDDFEAIMINDGSNDDSQEKLKQYEDGDKRFKLFSQKNKGLSKTRNNGIDYAKGDYIVFLDSDDFIDLDTLERFSKYADNNIDIIIGKGKDDIDSSKLRYKFNEYGLYKGKDLLKKALEVGRTPMIAQIYIYRRQFLKENMLKFKVGILHEDEEFTPRALLKADKIYLSDIEFYNYTTREGSITNKKDYRKNASDIIETCKQLSMMYDELEDEKLKKLLKDSLVSKYLYTYSKGRLDKYHVSFEEKKFVLENSYTTKNKIKSLLFNLSPKLYNRINKY